MVRKPMAERHPGSSPGRTTIESNIPCALSETDWKDVMVLTPNGPKPITSNLEWEKYHHVYNVGEFWSWIGEDW